MNALAVRGVTKRFGAMTALDDVTFDLTRGEFFSIVGPSNAGKSTLLKTVAGLHRPDAGRISILGRDVTDLSPAARNVSLLFQKAALFPMLNGFENIAFALREARIEQPEVEQRVRAIARRLKIEHILERLPRTFSGGEQQRTAIGRALVRRSDVLMLDEPLTNLDVHVRAALRLYFKQLHEDSAQTILYVTHDQAEAMTLSNRIAVLRAGRLEQIGSPDEIYHTPANRFVATFFGAPAMNILDVDLRKENDCVQLFGAGFAIPIPSADILPTRTTAWPKRLSLALRPESIRVTLAPSQATPIGAQITWVENLGRTRILTLRVNDLALKAVVPEDHSARAEGRAWIGFQPAARHFLDRETGLFLS